MEGRAAHQMFSLGVMTGPKGRLSPPKRTQVEIVGRGLFVRVLLTFEFESQVDRVGRIFLLEQPWNAVLDKVWVNQDSLLGLEETPPPAHPLAPAQLAAVEEEMTKSSTHLITVCLDDDLDLSRLVFEFVLAVEMCWHEGSLVFGSGQGPQREIEFKGRWGLGGLAGSHLTFHEASSGCRLETLEASKYRWSERVTVSSSEPACVKLSLDEKKAASIAVYSPSSSADSNVGCAAVAVVAPIRPQLVRDPVRLAIALEVRNPQEGLLLRTLVEKIAGLLNERDEFCLLLAGTEEPQVLVPWSSMESFRDESLGKILAPSTLGRAPNIWKNVKELAPDYRGATHLLLASSGSRIYPGADFSLQIPVFVFAMGRNPHRNQLESLFQRQGGFLSEGTSEQIEEVLAKLRIRLSPPLLSDFKLEGWGLDDVRPTGSTQVFTDQPTLVFGLYEGLLPKTVTLSGQSPAGQKLAQRVKVELLEEMDLKPLYQDRVRRWDASSELFDARRGPKAMVICLSDREELNRRFPPASSDAVPTVIDNIGAQALGPPTIAIASPAVSLENEMLGAPELSVGEPDLFSMEPMFGSPVQILKMDNEDSGPLGANEPDLFEDPDSVSYIDPPPEEEMSDFPSGPPMIRKVEEEDLFLEPSSQTPQSMDEESSTGETSWEAAQAKSPMSGPGGVQANGPVSVSDSWRSEWIDKFLSLDDKDAQGFLTECSIDWLGLSLSLLEDSVVEPVLDRMENFRKIAVRSQREWGRYLEVHEREEADRQLAQSMTKFGL